MSGARRVGRARAGMLLVIGMAGLSVLVGCTSGPVTPSSPAPSPSSTSPTATPFADLGSPEDYARALVDETNRARTAEGLPALNVSLCAQEQGAVRAQDLDAAGTELVHASLAPVTAACAPASMAGENLSRARLGPAEVVAAWMESPGHRENIVTPEFTEVGIACLVSGDAEEWMLCSQVFLGQAA